MMAGYSQCDVNHPVPLNQVHREICSGENGEEQAIFDGVSDEDVRRGSRLMRRCFAPESTCHGHLVSPVTSTRCDGRLTINVKERVMTTSHARLADRWTIMRLDDSLMRRTSRPTMANYPKDE